MSPLQGVKGSDGVYRLSDPALATSGDACIGGTDLGYRVVLQFLHNEHTCGELCKILMCS